MNKCYFQRWEESERGWGVRPDGCSIHLNLDFHKSYLRDIYNIRQHEALVPDEYDRIIGYVCECFISDSVFQLVQNQGSIRLMEHEMKNLFNLEEIIFKEWL